MTFGHLNFKFIFDNVDAALNIQYMSQYVFLYEIVNMYVRLYG